MVFRFSQGRGKASVPEKVLAEKRPSKNGTRTVFGKQPASDGQRNQHWFYVLDASAWYDYSDFLDTPLPKMGTAEMQESSTNVRWRILAMLMAYAGMCHFNRISISVAGTEHIMQDYSISETQMGMVYSSYLFVYTLCMMPGGWLIDRFGPKKALMFLGFGSAILVPLTGLASYAAGSMLFVLCVIRALLGVVSTPMHPGAARAVSFWMPYQTRGLANGLVTGAAVAGIASTYFVFGYLMDLVGWPSAFLVAGFATLM